METTPDPRAATNGPLPLAQRLALLAEQLRGASVHMLSTLATIERPEGATYEGDPAPRDRSLATVNLYQGGKALLEPCYGRCVLVATESAEETEALLAVLATLTGGPEAIAGLWSRPLPESLRRPMAEAGEVAA